MKKYSTPVFHPYGKAVAITAADFATSATDVYIGPDGTDLNPGNLTGSGPGCVDSNRDGVCDYLQQPN
jgi:hypothetical protein